MRATVLYQHVALGLPDTATAASRTRRMPVTPSVCFVVLSLSFVILSLSKDDGPRHVTLTLLKGTPNKYGSRAD